MFLKYPSIPLFIFALCALGRNRTHILSLGRICSDPLSYEGNILYPLRRSAPTYVGVQVGEPTTYILNDTSALSYEGLSIYILRLVALNLKLFKR